MMTDFGSSDLVLVAFGEHLDSRAKKMFWSSEWFGMVRNGSEWNLEP